MFRSGQNGMCRMFSSSGTITRYNRLPLLASALKTSPAKVLKEISLNHKKKIFSFYDGVWFKFHTTNDVIVPHTVASRLAQKTKRELSFFDMDDIPVQHSDVNPSIPVIAILGHYDHGKTTILDALGGTRIAEDEAHGITQVVRSRAVTLKPEKNMQVDTTFIDTPGQEIFFRMRNYGALVADVAVIVIAADEGVCNQTEESIGALEGQGIPIVVCINKIDLPQLKTAAERDARVRDVIASVREYVALSDAPLVTVSARDGTGLDMLTRAICDLIASSCIGTAAVQENEEQSGDFSTEDRCDEEAGLPMNVDHISCTGTGTVLNVWTNPLEGQMMHIVVTSGQVRMGQWYSAGGWAGAIQAISVDDVGANLSGTEFAWKGMGITIRLSNKRKTDPNPIGDKVYFFDNYIDAMQVSDHRFMELSLGSFAISPAEIGTYRLPQLVHSLSKGGKASKKSVILSSDGILDPSLWMQERLTAGRGGLIDGDEEETKEYAVVKTDTNLALCTFMDVLDEVNGKQEETEDGDAEGEMTVSTREVVRSGVGDIGLEDILVANAAKAPILAYAVGIHPAAAKEAETQGVSIYWFDKMQDVVDILLGASIDHKFVTKRPKRKRTT